MWLALGAAASSVACVVPSLRTSEAVVLPAQTRSFVEQFDTLWTRFDEVYPSFAYKRVDWHAQRDIITNFD